MAQSESDYEALVAMIYDAAIEPHGWPSVLERLADLVSAGTSAVIMQNVATGAGRSIQIRVPGPISDDYFGYYATRNVLLDKVSRVRTGQVVTDQELIAKSVLRSSEYYNDFLHPNGMNSLLALTAWRDERNLCVINLTRAPGRDEFDGSDRTLLAPFVPHLVRAIAMSLRLAQSECRSAASDAALDMLAHAVVLFDDQARIVFANLAAREMSRPTGGLRLMRDGVAAATPDATRKLTAAIGRAARERIGTALPLPRPEGRPLSALVTPLGGKPVWLLTNSARALLVVTDPDLPGPIPEAQLCALFGLTRAEAAVATALTTGASAQEIAQTLGIGMATLRQHISRTLAKTGTTRQAELMRLLLLTSGSLHRS